MSFDFFIVFPLDMWGRYSYKIKFRMGNCCMADEETVQREQQCWWKGVAVALRKRRWKRTNPVKQEKMLIDGSVRTGQQLRWVCVVWQAINCPAMPFLLIMVLSQIGQWKCSPSLLFKLHQQILSKSKSKEAWESKIRGYDGDVGIRERPRLKKKQWL